MLLGVSGLNAWFYRWENLTCGRKGTCLQWRQQDHSGVRTSSQDFRLLTTQGWLLNFHPLPNSFTWLTNCIQVSALGSGACPLGKGFWGHPTWYSPFSGHSSQIMLPLHQLASPHPWPWSNSLFNSLCPGPEHKQEVYMDTVQWTKWPMSQVLGNFPALTKQVPSPWKSLGKPGQLVTLLVDTNKVTWGFPRWH